MAAVVAAQRSIAVQHERDVAVGAAEGRAAGTAMQRGRDPTTVQEQDRLAAVLGELPSSASSRAESLSALAAEDPRVGSSSARARGVAVGDRACPGWSARTGARSQPGRCARHGRRRRAVGAHDQPARPQGAA